MPAWLSPRDWAGEKCDVRVGNGPDTRRHLDVVIRGDRACE